MEKKTSSSIEFENLKDTELRLGLPGAANEPARAQKRALVVGWPPVRNFRKLARKSEPESSGMFVKVSMDGAAYLRKLDLKMYKGYKEMKEALENLFKNVSVEYVIVYVDKDGDWMLVGDVPWSMFVQSCTKLRIMKASEAGGFNLSSYNAS